MALLFPYRHRRLHRPAVTLHGRTVRPKPLIDVTIVGPAGSRVTEALLDTGADDTVFPEYLAQWAGIGLANAEEAEASGVGGSAARLLVAQVTLRIATATEQREWEALVAFTSAPLRFPLLGFAGFLQYFSAHFHGDREEVELTVNASYPGR